MITLKEFIKEVNDIDLEFNYYQIRDIYNAIQTETYYTFEELEKDYKYQSTVVVSKNISIISLIESLIEFKGNEQNIVDMINSHYGEMIELFYLEEDELYSMTTGHKIG